MKKISETPYIAIATRGRIDAQRTLKGLTPEIRKWVTLFCHPGEYEAHKKNWGREVKEIIEYDKSAKHIGEIREWIAWNAPNDKVIFLDDNIRLSVRLPEYKTPRTMNEDNFDEEDLTKYQKQIFMWIWKTIQRDDIAIAALSFRPFNRDTSGSIEYNKRFFAIWGLDVKKYKSQINEPVWMSDWSLKEDFIVGIAMVKMGYNIAISNKYSFDKTVGSNSKGGCSSYRTVEYQNSVALRMAKEFPDWVTIKKRDNKNKRWCGEFENKESLDVIIKWKEILNQRIV